MYFVYANQKRAGSATLTSDWIWIYIYVLNYIYNFIYNYIYNLIHIINYIYVISLEEQKYFIMIKWPAQW